MFPTQILTNMGSPPLNFSFLGCCLHLLICTTLSPDHFMCLWEDISALMGAFQECKLLKHSGKVKEKSVSPLGHSLTKGPKQASWVPGLPTLYPRNWASCGSGLGGEVFERQNLPVEPWRDKNLLLCQSHRAGPPFNQDELSPWRLLIP